MLMYLGAFLAYFVKGLSGFANTLVFTSVLSFSEAAKVIAPVELPLTLPANAYLAWKGRKDMDIRRALPMLALVLVGMAPGVLFLKTGGDGIIKLLLGVTIAAVGVLLLLTGGSGRKESTALMVISCLLSGIFSGLFGISVFLAAYINSRERDPGKAKAMICLIFLAENIFRAAVYGFTGLITAETLLASLKLAPVGAAGLLLGSGLSGKLDARITRKIICLLLIASGISIIIKNI